MEIRVSKYGGNTVLVADVFIFFIRAKTYHNHHFRNL